MMPTFEEYGSPFLQLEKPRAHAGKVPSKEFLVPGP